MTLHGRPFPVAGRAELRADARGRDGGVRQKLAAGMTDDRNLIHFPAAETMPTFAVAFLGMMFAHAKFEAQVYALESAIKVTPRKRHRVAKPKGDRLGDARARPKQMAKLINDRPGLVENRERSQIVQILRAAIKPCDQRNLLAHGRWWRFDPKTSTIEVRGDRRQERGHYTESKIAELAETFKTLDANLYTLRSAIENRRGDHDVHESDLPT
jgi:hypothetical protein